jgi:guanosine-3',5'-bis(diphosphate) 3'-pyrophosphohydrolase
MKRPHDMKLFLKALEFSANKHRRQRRKDRHASPYINHPIALAKVLAWEGRVADVEILAAALLHDTIEDTRTTFEELRANFGRRVALTVLEVTDNKKLHKRTRKRLQVEHAAHLSRGAKLVKLADKICNLRDLSSRPPVGWDRKRRREYFDWARAVIDRLRGVHPKLEAAFDAAYARRPGVRKSRHAGPAR